MLIQSRQSGPAKIKWKKLFMKKVYEHLFLTKLTQSVWKMVFFADDCGGSLGFDENE